MGAAGSALGFGDRREVGAVEYEGFCSRMCNALCGVAVGIALFWVAIGLLGWNEFNYVRNVKVISKVKLDTFIYNQCVPDLARDGQGVYASCPLTQLNDFAANEFKGRLRFADEASPAGKLLGVWFEASSQIYQWTEVSRCTDETTTGGGKKTTCLYSYTQEWAGAAVQSSRFFCLSYGRNMYSPGCPGARGEPTMPPLNRGAIPGLLQGTTLPADYTVAMGQGFHLNRGLLTGGIFGGRAVGLDASTSLPPEGILQDKQVFFMDGQAYFAAAEPSSVPPSIGDVRSRFAISDVRGDGSSTLSVVAKQQDGRSVDMAAWDTGMSGTMAVVNWAVAGPSSLDDMVREKQGENSALTMLLRAGGFLLMFLGLQLVTGPIALAPEIVPCIGGFLGEVVGCALCRMNFATSLGVSLVVIGVAWTLARPLVGFVLLASAAALFAVAFILRQKSRSSVRHMDQGVFLARMA